jgi:hypothetical protein
LGDFVAGFWAFGARPEGIDMALFSYGKGGVQVIFLKKSAQRYALFSEYHQE